MLKQSLVQEKISDLTIGAPQPSNSSTTTTTTTTTGGNNEKKIIDTNIISLISSSSSPNAGGKRIFGSSKYAREIIIATTTATTNDTTGDPNQQQQAFLPTYLKKPLSNVVNNDESSSGQQQAYHNQNHNLSAMSRNSFVNNNNSNGGGFGASSNQLNSNNNNNNARFMSNSAANLFEETSTAANQVEATLKLSYLEKSIRFIQDQHTEILTGLHQEIEKLKTENRELHFKLATRKTSASDSGNKPTSTTTIGQEGSDVLNSSEGFGKAYAESQHETNLGKKLTDIKSGFEANKYDEVAKRLRDAESKNDYLTSVINELQAAVSSTTTATRRHSATNATRNQTNSQAIGHDHHYYSKLGVHNIVSTDPLKIRLNENDEPRSPTVEESDALLKRLFNNYKLQKQQISNMKTVLRDLMSNESLSNQSMTMARDLLEDPNRLNQYLIDNGSTIQKLSPPKSSSTNGRVNNNLNHHHQQQQHFHNRFGSQVVLSNTGHDAMQQAAGGASSMRGAGLNLTGTGFNIVHLPPLITNPAKYPERQRRTQLLQKQRLRKEYFH